MISAARAYRRARGALAVDVAAALGLVGVLLLYLSPAFLVPAAVALGYSEPVWPFLAAGGICAGLGLGLERAAGRPEGVGVREGFLVVSLTWLLAPAVAALPHIFASVDQLGSPLNAYFEEMSAFTTTGASVITEFDAVPRSLMLWRQFTQWLGGMGIIVLALAVLPRLRVGGRQLLEHELPGPEFERLATSIRATARRLWLLYVGLTALEALVLAVLGWSGVDERMSPYKAVAHALTTLPTGGFSTEARSIGAFAAATQWTIALFMVVAGANFALTYRAVVRRQPRAAARDSELHLYLVLLALGALVLVSELLGEGIFAGEAAIRHAVFQSVSMMTTTGFATADFTQWSALAAMTLVALMFIGGSAGSTAGSIKVVRHLLIGKLLRRELDQTLHPQVVASVRLNGRVVDERTLRAVLTFVLLYVGIFVLGSLGIVIEAARADLAVSPFDGIAAAATTIGNVGPGFGFAGPMGSFEPFSNLSKLIMIGLMWLGRLEIVPIVVLFTRSYWRA
ncbi:MAG: TrkH family potassium uptake protein [Actinomycetota bacterium]|nr:TrkH family potassium uptake protein [Actinomycetota bacterium]